MKNLKIEIPSFRKDLIQEIDLIEEIARIRGYEKIPLTIPAVRPSVEGVIARNMLNIITETLVSQGLNEVITYSLVSKDILGQAGLDSKEAIGIANPLSSQQEILRPGLLPGLLAAVSENINQEEGVLIFEIGRVFKPAGETLALGIVLVGQRQLYRSWGKIKDTFGLLHLKGIIELLLNKLGIGSYDLFADAAPDLKDSYQQMVKVKIKQGIVGYLGQVKKAIALDFDIKEKQVFIAELNLDKVLAVANLDRKFAPLPLYPAVRRDISLLIKEDISTKEILSEIKAIAPALLKEVKVVDSYQGREIPPGFKACTLSCLYLSNERTLTSEEVSSCHNALCDFLKERLQIHIR